MCELYEVVIFTASTSNYADKVLDELDPERRAPHRLYRQHCTLINCDFVKDLSQLGRDLKDVIIVDNLASCYALQPCNGIPILTWTDNKSDRELDRLSSILELLAKVDDVRDYLREVVRDNELDYPEAIRLLSGEITLDEVQKNPSAFWTSPRKKVAPQRDRTQSQKKLMPFLGNLKENFENSKEIATDQKDIVKKNEKIEENDIKARKITVEVIILPKETVAEIKERVKTEMSSSINEQKPDESSNTPIVKKERLINRTYSSSLVGSSNVPTYYSSKPAPLANKPEKSSFYKSTSESVKNVNSTVTEDNTRNEEKSSNIMLPPRPNYKRNVNSFAPKPIKNLSSEANKYIEKNTTTQGKPFISSFRKMSATGIETPTQLNPYKPPTVPSYAKYINTRPSLHRYPVHNGHSSSTSVAQYSYTVSELPGGTSTPSRNYGGFSTPSGVWAPKLY